MKITKTLIHDSYVLEPNVFRDERGFFYESWNSETFNKAIKKKKNAKQPTEQSVAEEEAAAEMGAQEDNQSSVPSCTD